jgi:hypothetical protein
VQKNNERKKEKRNNYKAVTSLICATEMDNRDLEQANGQIVPEN